jgi:hypothetical protein
MARGWESKSVEQQQDAARSAKEQAHRELTSDERTRAQRRHQLQLALARTQADLQRACHPRHRDMLRQQLESINAALKE